MPSILPREIFSLLWQNVNSRALVNETLVAFRRTESLPSIGAAAPEFIDGVGWSDHWSFWQEGFPAIEITDTAPFRNPYYHTPQDTPDRLNYYYLAHFAWAMRAVVRQATSRTAN